MQYVAAEYIVALHAALIEETGGAHGLRDHDLLASLVERPKQQFSGRDLYHDVFEKAAVYLDSLARYHMFVDGNKRTAVMTAAYFLHLNGYELKATNKAIERFVIRVVKEKPEIRVIARWLREHSRLL